MLVIDHLELFYLTLYSTSSFALINGGTAGLVWTYIATIMTMLFVILSLAEISSMYVPQQHTTPMHTLLTRTRAPSAGGVYFWVGDFAPDRAQKYLSYLVGWTNSMAWCAGAASLNLFTTFIHFFGILIILVPLWVLTPKNTSKEVFKGFGDSGAWGNLGLACVVGQIGPLFALSRADGSSHIGQ
jgi:choline transport protein